MTNYPPQLSGIQLIPAPADHQPILANLLELYVHDFSEIVSVHPGPDGRFGYAPLPLYWVQPDHHPFLVKVDGQWAGFALVRKNAESAWDMAEFFVVRSHRRRGVGSVVAHQVWKRFPGPWRLRVMDANPGANRFWQHAISTFVGRPVLAAPFEEDGVFWRHFSFSSEPPA